MKIIHITTGDLKGIGLEVALKALKTFRPSASTRFVLWRSPDSPKEVLKIPCPFLKKKVLSLKKFLSLLPALKNPKSLPPEGLLEIVSPLGPTEWVKRAAGFCLKNKNHHALVTAPLSKTQMNKEGFVYKGHTGLLKALSKSPYVFMTFLGKTFNVILLTGHIPLKQIKITGSGLKKCFQLCLNFQNKHPHLYKGKKPALVALNPHAGEEGLLGKEEFLMKQALQPFSHQIQGPLVPDTAFFKSTHKKTSFYICPYHDQGLIPFKMVHGRKSFQLSLGLPFLRTSVSHGTGFDIFGQNKASSASMQKALQAALRFM